jgi:CheY-like chemotaxis protein
VAHEVNNALVGILGETEVAHGSADRETLQAAMARVATQGRRIAEIVQGLLGFARPHPPQREAVNLHDLVRDTLLLMAHDLSRSHVRSETRFAPDLPPVLADAKQIQQVLVNLFTNAAQAMDTKGGTLLVTLQPAQGGVSIEVHDSGVGIPEENLPRVFDPFFSTKEGGNGLGLSVSYSIIRAHGGEMTVHSTPAEGTTFAVHLPAAAAAEGSGAHTVLLVDDDAAVAETLAIILAREGLVVQRAATGEEALAAVARERFDAIFLDVRLPDISGPQVYARLLAERPDMARRVIFVTGGLWRVESRGLRDKLPPQPTLSKPCTLAQIREALRLLRDTRAAA